MVTKRYNNTGLAFTSMYSTLIYSVFCLVWLSDVLLDVEILTIPRPLT